MSTSVVQQLEFAVVDATVDDYTHLLPVLERYAASATFFATGSEAIKNGGRSSADCWLINLRLPDMSGLDLYRQLQRRINGATVFLVADEFQPEMELAVLATGTACFACKPLHPSWLEERIDWDRLELAKAGGQESWRSSNVSTAKK